MTCSTPPQPFARFFLSAILSFPLCFTLSCSSDSDQGTDPRLTPSVFRFEQELDQAARKGPDSVARLRKSHPLFYKLLVEEMMGMGPADSNTTAYLLCQFQRDLYTDSLVRDIYEAFPADRDPLLYRALPNAIARFRKEFHTPTPTRITTFLSGFRYQAALDDSGELLIGLDTYLGRNYRYYATAHYIYEYQTRRMSRDYLLPDALRLLLQDQLSPPPSTASLLEEMIAAGKVHYAIQKLQPGIPDSSLFRYTSTQAAWAARHEKDVWKYLMGQNLVYASELRLKSRFLDDGPATLELDPEAPPRLGEWIGASMVGRYMKKHPEVTLPDLFQKKEIDIFKASGYRGERQSKL